jgi:hypothetical protein
MEFSERTEYMEQLERRKLQKNGTKWNILRNKRNKRNFRNKWNDWNRMERRKNGTKRNDLQHNLD